MGGKLEAHTAASEPSSGTYLSTMQRPINARRMAFGLGLLFVALLLPREVLHAMAHVGDHDAHGAAARIELNGTCALCDIVLPTFHTAAITCAPVLQDTRVPNISVHEVGTEAKVIRSVKSRGPPAGVE